MPAVPAMANLAGSAGFLGDRKPGSTVYFFFNTSAADGTPTTLTGAPVVSAYKDGNTTEVTTGVTLNVDYDGRTGLNQVVVVTANVFYAAGSDFALVLTSGAVGAVSVVGAGVGTFALSKVTATLADGVPHGGTPGSGTATLALSKIWVQNGDVNSDAVIFQNISANGGSGLRLNGVGDAGLHSTGGFGGRFESNDTNGYGLFVTGAGNAAGMSVLAGATGEGLIISGGTHGLEISAGGGVNNNGNTNNDGVRIFSSGDGRGMLVDSESGAGACVVMFNGGATDAVQVNGATSVDTIGRHRLLSNVTKNKALANFEFVMTNSSGVPTPGLAVAASRSIDGGAYGPCANAVSPVASGRYKISLATTDLNGSVIGLLFTAAGAADLNLTVVTTP